jgi:hypothetical protein
VGMRPVISGEELWDVVTKSGSEMPLSTVAHAHAHSGHHQVILTILEHKGSNEFLSDSKGLHCGARQRSRSSEGGDGVFLVPEPMEEVDTMQHHILSEQRQRKLTHEWPDITCFPTHEYNFHDDQQQFLLGKMDADNMHERVFAVWAEDIAAEMDDGEGFHFLGEDISSSDSNLNCGDNNNDGDSDSDRNSDDDSDNNSDDDDNNSDANDDDNGSNNGANNNSKACNDGTINDDSDDRSPSAVCSDASVEGLPWPNDDKEGVLQQ